MILNLVPPTDPILREKLERFDFSNPPVDPKEIAVNLTETMLHHKGLGLAANQVGLKHRAFVVNANPVLCCFNPVIVDESNTTTLLEEGCLTFPGRLLKIKRPDRIKIRYTMPNGETVTQVYQGMTARIMSHETDHLNGVLFMEKAGKVHLRMALAKEKSLI